MTTDPLAQRSRNLEDEFFLKEDRRLIERLKHLKQAERTKQALADASGIRDEGVLRKLMELQIQPETVAALSVVPLVEVAWADGTLDARERDTVLAGAGKLGFEKGGIEYTLLEQWLSRKPEPKLFEAWRHLVQGLCLQMSPEETDLLKENLLRQARAVASAAGGFLGIGRVSEAENRILAALEDAFRAG